jgi:hypothetical protein
MITFNYQNTLERDIDRIICEEIYSSQKFFDLFTTKLSRKGSKVLSIFHSKRTKKSECDKNEYGETDIEVIYEYENEKHAILIEDKISAEPQPDQAERYKNRGEKDVREGRYVDFVTFIVAPQRYLDNPANMTDKYDYAITHDEIAKYFQNNDDLHSEFRFNCFSSSLTKCQYSSRTLKSEKVPDFFVEYAKQLESSSFDNLQIIHLPQTKTKPNWVQLKSEIENSYIMHKCNNKDPLTNEPSGFIDVILNKYSQENIDKIKTIVDPVVSKLEWTTKPVIEAIGKTQIGIRMRIVPIRNDIKLSDQKGKFQKCLKDLSDMYELTRLLSDKL